MQPKKILKAAFRVRNLAILAGVVIVSYLTGYVPFMFIGAAGYLYFVIQTLNSNVFVKEYSEDEKIDNIQELNSQCNNLYHQSRKVIDKQFYRNIKGIMRDKDDILNLFNKDEDDYIKQKVVEQAINLAMAYINLISDYSQRRRKVASYNASEFVNGISANEQKLRYLKDPQAIEDIRHSIEMNRKVLEKINGEKTELERTSAKLTFIESTLKSFKQQTLSDESNDETAMEIENIINESAALDNVLNNDRNSKLSI